MTTPGRLRHGNAETVAVMRLATVPLVLVSGVNAAETIVRDTEYLLLAAVLQAYAIAVWVAVRRGTPPPAVLVLVLDVAGILALALAADLAHSAAARFAPFLLVATWTFVLPQRRVVPWTLALSAVLLAGQALIHGVDHLPRVAMGLSTLVVLAAVVSTFVERRRERVEELVAHAEELRQEARGLERRERARIAQLLHDDALQRLLAARQELDHGLTTSDPDALARAREGMREATAALRGLTLAIDDADLEAAGLDAAVRRLVQDLAARRDLRAEVDVAPAAATDDDGEVIAIVRELLGAAEGQTGPTTLRVDVAREGDAVVVTVDVDGAESPVPVAARRDATLERAVAELGGVLDVTRSADGVRMRASVAVVAAGERRSVQADLRHEREWNSALVAALPDPFIVSTQDLRLIEVSDRFIGLTGWTRAELLAAPAGDLPYWPKERRAEIRGIALGLNDEGAHEVEMSIAHRDGHDIDVIASAQLVRDPRGGRTLQLVTFKDITRRRAAERRVRDEAALNRALGVAMRDPYFHTRDGVVIVVNDTFCEMLGHPRSAIEGARRPYFFLAEETLDDAFDYARRIDTDGFAQGEFLVVHADGHRIRVSCRGVAVTDEDGVHLGRVQTAAPLEHLPAP